MERISTFMYCEGAGLGPGISINAPQTLHVISPIHVITPEFIPTMYSFAAVFGILGVDTEKPHKVQICFRNSSNKSVSLFTTELELPPSPAVNQDIPLEMQGFIMNMIFQNIRLDNDGTYETEIIVDDKPIGTCPIQVKGKNNHV